MARNLSRKFATMSEEERLRFAQEESEGTDDRPTELDFEEPRGEDRAVQKQATERRSADPDTE